MNLNFLSYELKTAQPLNQIVAGNVSPLWTYVSLSLGHARCSVVTGGRGANRVWLALSEQPHERRPAREEILRLVEQFGPPTGLLTK